MPIPPKQLKAFADANKKPPLPSKKPGGFSPPKQDAPLGNPGDEEPENDDIDAAESDEELAERVGKQVQSGDTDDGIMDLMATFTPEDNPPEWVADEDTWERAKKAVDPEGAGADKYDDPWAVVAHVYDKMGGARK